MSKILIVILVAVLFIAGPLLVIWSLNVLFPVLAIPYTMTTWVAALILGVTVGPRVRVTKS
jgi:hypothetical protein